jgi:hypothetical protein
VDQVEISNYSANRLNPILFNDPNGDDPTKRAKEYAQKHGIENASIELMNNGKDVFMSWGADGVINGKKFKYNFWDRVESALNSADNWTRRKVQTPMGEAVQEYGKPIEEIKYHLKTAGELGVSVDFGLKKGVIEANVNTGVFSTNEKNFGLFSSGDLTENFGVGVEKGSGVNGSHKSPLELTFKISFYSVHRDKYQMSVAGTTYTPKVASYTSGGVGPFEIERQNEEGETTTKISIGLDPASRKKLPSASGGVKVSQEVKSKTGLITIGR